MAECRLIKSDELEVEISSGSVTRLAGVSQGLTGAAGIHLAIATIPASVPELVETASTYPKRFAKADSNSRTLAPAETQSLSRAR